MANAALQVIKVLRLNVFKIKVGFQWCVTHQHLSVSHSKYNFFNVASQTKEFVVYIGVLAENSSVLELGWPLDPVSFTIPAELQKGRGQIYKQPDAIDDVLARVRSYNCAKSFLKLACCRL